MAILFRIGGILLLSCHGNLTKANRFIIVQPLSDFSPAMAIHIFRQISQVSQFVILKPPIPLPPSAYYALGNRYRADTLIHYPGQMGNANSLVIGITNKDISAAKDRIPDWGIMGLGYGPGNACVVSTFRLSAGSLSDQCYKVVIHELGHTQGLPHCPNKSCFMCDAAGGNVLNQESGFCETSSAFLKKKAWKL